MKRKRRFQLRSIPCQTQKNSVNLDSQTTKFSCLLSNHPSLTLRLLHMYKIMQLCLGHVTLLRTEFQPLNSPPNWTYCAGLSHIGLCPIFLVCLCTQTVSHLSNSTFRARCTNVVQLWTRVKSEFEPSSAVNCVAPKRFKRWSPFNSELPSDHRSNFDLGSTRGYACALGNKFFPR